ncbi:SdiA-regulated domain-containing protein [Sphingomonas arantia]|uniref:SdiA-regulated domain-containing protein n=1 Tax=Sphingomonas arantia TaxID=1460676 RepID=A0ABW4TU94_9SPHN
MDLSNYTRVATYDLPEPTRTTAPTGNLLAQEASGVAYNRDTNTLFIVGDGGTSVTQVSLTGQFIDAMTLAQGSSPQGTTFYDSEGITYIGGGKFVFTEERTRQVVEFTYAPGTTLTREAARTVDLGTDIGNVGLEGLSYDPLTGGYIVVKEKDALGIFQTNIDFAAGTATNGSATTVNSTNLFDPARIGTTDLSDVYALSNYAGAVGTADESRLLVLSQESGRIVEVGRDGTVYSSLQLVAPATPSGIDLAAMTVEGITVDSAGRIYLVSEEGGGDIDHPQLWVYAPTTTGGANLAPTGVTLSNPTAALLENSNTADRIKVADIAVADDGLGTNQLTVTGADAAAFELSGNALYLKAGTTLDFETKASYSVAVNVDDTTVGATPDASVAYTLNVTNIVNEAAAGTVAITEVAPWASSSRSGADWFELTNTGSTAIDVTGWKFDDNSYSSTSAVALSGVTTIAAGQSAIFLEGGAAQIATFANIWFGGTVPAGVQIGTYTGAGVGLSNGGDAANVFDAAGTLKASVTFGASPSGPYATFDNAAQINSTSLVNHATISTFATAGTNGAFVAPGDATETGSPGTIGGVAAPVNRAPSAIGLTGEITTLPDTTSTDARVKIASVIVTDDGLGTNGLTLSGADAGAFEVDATGLYLKAGQDLDANVKARYDVTVNVDDVTVGTTPDASVRFSLDLTANTTGQLRITEVAPWSSGNSPVQADWFEVTNTGTAAVNITGWKFDDSSRAFANAVALSGVTSIAAGESVIFLETATAATTVQSFIDTWFGGTAPAGLQFGTYTGGGVGLSTGGDAVTLFNASGVVQASVTFGASPAGPYPTFDNGAALDNATIATFSADGVRGAFAAARDGAEIGSPGTILTPETVGITVTGTEGADGIGGTTGSDTLIGLGGDDVLIGGTGSDRMSGGDGADYLDGGDGVDRLDGDAGNDTLLGQAGNDTLIGSGGLDRLSGGAGADYLDGGDDADRLDGDAGDDILLGQNGNDTLIGSDGIDVLSGGEGADYLDGGAGNDQLVGDAGDDILLGQAGNDTMSGGAGNDYFDGGAGNDYIDGGAGNDTIVAGLGNDILIGGEGRDTVALAGSVVDFSFQSISGGFSATNLATGAVTQVFGVEEVTFALDLMLPTPVTSLDYVAG